ncbi:MAG: ribulokinase [Verrucomicrobia bacterium]|nr:ribulokinase [Verrucomicrobiota bacterium]MCH8512245.1 ribulokinase [Kiritimatiellia bacterium]
MKTTIGLDFGTNSVRALVVDTADGRELGSAVYEYEHGDMGVVIDAKDPNLARQHPADYLTGIERTILDALAEAGPGVADSVVGIGVDTTGSTPIPVDAKGEALALQPEFADNPNAMAWLWKDHTSTREALEITEAAAARHPEYLAKCGGTYSSEWYWAKLLKCARTDAKVFQAAASWVELADWVPAVLTGTTALAQVKRCICAAGHKAMFNPAWGGYPAESFLSVFDDGVLTLARKTLPDIAYNVSQAVGALTADWAARLGLPAGIPVAAGAFDCHLGAIGSGIRPGTMVKVIGTSTCDLAVLPMGGDFQDIPGVCGVVPESVLPGNYGVEAGQSAVGDIFNWYVHKLQPGAGMDHAALNRAAENLRPGESGLLALDWHNGNRTVLVDQELTGLVLGLTLHSSPGELFRAWVESTAFGARMIRDRMTEYGVPVDRVIACGGISLKSPMLMQIYADVLNCPMLVSGSEQTCALGSAMAGAVVAGVYPDFDRAAEAMTNLHEVRYDPIPENVKIYERLFGLYKRLHDLFGTREYAENQYEVMKALIELRNQERGRA